MSGQRPHLNPGDVVLAPYPFFDQSGRKVRPALVVGRVLDADVILALITTRQVVADSRVELLLQPSDPEFARTNLNSASVIRMHKLVTLDRRLVRGRIGRVGPQTMQRVKESLRFVLEL